MKLINYLSLKGIGYFGFLGIHLHWVNNSKYNIIDSEFFEFKQCIKIGNYTIGFINFKN